MGFGIFFNNFEWEVLYIVLNSAICPFTTNHSLGIEDSVLRIGGQLIFGSISNETFTFSCECDIWGSDTVSLIICNDFYPTIFEYTNTRKKEKYEMLLLISWNLNCNTTFIRIELSIGIKVVCNLPGVSGSQVNTDDCSQLFFLFVSFCPWQCCQRQHQKYAKLHL